MNSSDFSSDWILSLLKIFEPLSNFESVESIKSTLSEFGWVSEIELDDIAAVQSTFSFIGIFSDISDILTQGLEPETLLQNVPQLLNLVTDLISSLRDVPSSPADYPQVFPFNQDEFWSTFPEEIWNYMVYRYVKLNHPSIFGVLKILGIMSEIQVPEDELPIGRASYTRYTVSWSRIPRIFTDLSGLMEEVYNWGLDQHSVEGFSLLLGNISELLNGLGLRAHLQPASEYLLDDYYPDSDIRSEILELKTHLFKGYDYSGPHVVKVDLIGLPIPPPDVPNAYPHGIMLAPEIEGSTELSFDIGSGFVITFKGQFGSEAGIRLEITPTGIQVVVPPDFGTEIYGALSLLKKASEDSSILLFGTRESSHLELGGIGLTVYVDGTITSPEFGIEATFEDGHLLISTGEGDGFIQKLLSGISLESNFDFVIGWSSLRGLYFRGSATLEIDIPIHKTLGPIDLDSLYLMVGIPGDTGEIPLTLALSFGAKLGPVNVAVKRIGLILDLGFPDGGGNFGPLNLGIAFRWPDGIGISVDTEGLTGGGYLDCDQTNERYAGVLQLSFKEIGLLAITLITTRLPDGSKGFSMLALINVTFNPAITLPYNFNLHGVGGLFGLNRRMDVDVIVEGLKTGIVDSVMFPEGDVIARAPEIISDLRSIFPPTEGRHVIGLMAKLSWSELVFADLGIFIEVPMPIKIVLLGQLYTYLPDEAAPIIELHLDFMGVLDLEQQKLYFLASIYDSRILKLELYGDAYIGICWGSKPYFVLSLGGFHPRDKTVPTDIPALRRLTLSLGSGNNPRITLKTYLALTSTSLGFGARLDLIAKSGKFSVEGYMGFDALIIFSPFSFEVEMGAGVAIKVGGSTLLSLSLDLLLSGPTPWHAAGTVKFKIIFFEVKIKVSATWGSKKKATLPRVNPWLPLEEALKHNKSWGTAQIGGKPSGVQIMQSEGSEDSVLVYPTGYLEIRQNVLPFDIKITRFRNASPSGDINQFSINSVTVDGTELNTEPTLDYFARPQYQEMSDSEKLSSPAYEKINSGVRCKAEEINAALDDQVGYELVYETEIIDENKMARKLSKPTKCNWGIGKYILKAGAASSYRSSKYGIPLVKPFAEPLEESYSIVSTADMTEIPNEDIPDNGSLTYVRALQEMDEYLGGHSDMNNQVQIVPKCEVSASG